MKQCWFSIRQSKSLPLLVGVLFLGCSFVSATGEITQLQSSLDTKKDALLTSLDTTLGRVQKTYESKVKGLVGTSMFKAVECLGYLRGTSADVDVKAIKNEYQKAILEKYVEVSADIRRYAVGLIADEGVVSGDIADFSQSFASQISAIESTYDTTYEKLKTDFTTYYGQNKELILALAEKLQRIDTIQEKYRALVQAEEKFYVALDAKTSLRSALEAPKKSAVALLQGDIDDMIRDYQTTNPEISDEKMQAKRDALVQGFIFESDSFLYELFKSDFDYSLYTRTLPRVQEFLSQYFSDGTYQCGLVVAAPTNWERLYLSLTTDLDSLLAGYATLLTKVEHWSDAQAKTVESTLFTLYQDVYSKSFNQKRTEFRTYVMQLISEAYYVAHQQPEDTNVDAVDQPSVSVSWTPYVFTKSYTKGTSAPELTYLQQFLKAEGLYQGEITGRYDAATIEAVYQFQLQEGVVTGKEIDKAAYGRMGPATRRAVNAKMNP